MAELRSIKQSDVDLKNGRTNHGFDSEQYPQEKDGINGSVEVTVVNLTDKEKRRAKLKIIKNLFTVSFGFLLLFTAFQAISNLQSSINSIDGLGTASLSVIYAALVISCMFVPPYMIARFGCKYTLIISMLMYSTYFMGNFYAHWYTLIPTSVILGLGGAPLWSAKCTYLTEIANQYSALTGEAVESVVVKFFGVFFMVFQSGQIWGNLISAYVLKPSGVQDDVDNDPEILELCGVNFCNEQSLSSGNKTNTNLERPPDSKIYFLCGIYLGCALLAALFIFLVLDQLKRGDQEEEGVKKGSNKPSLKLLVETFRHMRKPQQLLIIPLTMYSGIEQAFITTDFTKGYVSCAWGIHNIGMVMICFGISNALSSVSFGPLVKIFGRIPIFVFGTLLHVMMVVTLFLWSPNPEDEALFFVIAGLWGMGDAVWQTQINGLYGVLFAKDEEAAFSNYRLWESLGFILAFAYNNYLCIDVKLYILVAFLAAGMLGYIIVEVQVRAKQSNIKQSTS